MEAYLYYLIKIIYFCVQLKLLSTTDLLVYWYVLDRISLLELDKKHTERDRLGLQSSQETSYIFLVVLPKDRPNRREKTRMKKQTTKLGCAQTTRSPHSM